MACNDSDNNGDDNETEMPVVVTPPPAPMEYSYTVMVSNLTHSQPMSAITGVLHGDTTLWKIGEEASEPIEKIAESGDNTDLLAMESILASGSNGGILMPGTSAEFTISTTDENANYFSIISMLVNTNDAFTGLTGVDISSMEVDATNSWVLGTYDAGTEGNSEMMGTIPGPADGGTGFDAMRDDVNYVAMHPGIVSKDDGLTQSVLTQAHRFDNPTLKLTITRTK